MELKDNYQRSAIIPQNFIAFQNDISSMNLGESFSVPSNIFVGPPHENPFKTEKRGIREQEKRVQTLF